MKPLRWWAPVLGAVIALASGIATYIALNISGKIPVGLRENPWPMEAVAILATAALGYFAVSAYREKRHRILATICAALAALSTAGFLLLVHVATYKVPPPPSSMVVGNEAPDFTLTDESGQPLSLASLRGHRVLLVFYRGYW